MNYYVYYKLDAAQLAAARSLVNELFEQIKQKFGVHGRWMRRRDDPSTYMEVYEGVKDEAAFEALLEGGSAKLGAQFNLRRKVERFISAETPV